MSCNLVADPTGCLGRAAPGQAASQATQGWDAICQSFAKAAEQLLGSFAKSFAAIPPVSLSSLGVRSVYGLSLEIAALIAAMLLMVQVIRTVLTHDGSAIAHGLVGVGKAAVAFVLTLGAAATALRASDELTRWIVTRSFGSPQALSARLAHLAAFDPSVSPSLLLILALIGILVTVALWAQLLLRNVAVTLLVAISPVAAAGQVAESTHMWWRKLVRATLQLIALKPAVALIFALGLTLPGASGRVEKLLAGMLVLLLAAFAWPAMARVSSVMEVHVGGGVLGGIRGGVSARISGDAPGGVNPAELSRVAEARTMSAVHEGAMRAAEAAQGRPPAGGLPAGRPPAGRLPAGRPPAGRLPAARPPAALLSAGVGASVARSPRNGQADDGLAGHGDGLAGHGDGVAGHGDGVAGHGDGVAGHGDGHAGTADDHWLASAFPGHADATLTGGSR